MLQDLLLAISTNKVPQSELEQKFDKIAIELLRQNKLVSDSNEYFIREIEFYFYSEYYGHLDPYIHAKNEKHPQNKFGQWYFHKFKSITNYKNQPRKGVDITFGNKEQKNRGGILIRKITNRKTNKTLDGIGNIVSAIINDIGEVKFEKLTQQDISVFDPNSPLRLVTSVNPLNKPLFKGPRKKLEHKKEDIDSIFLEKNYNYFNDIEYKIVTQ